MIDSLWKYYGIDWIAMIFTFFGIYFLGNKDRKGFVVMMSGNACWISLGVFVGSIGLILANAVFFSMNMRGLFKWSKEKISSS